MNTDEILKAAQKQSEQQAIGEYEKEVYRDGVVRASIAMVILCMVMLAVELLICKKIDFGKPAMLFCVSGVINYYEGKLTGNPKIKLKAGLEIVVTLILFIFYIGALFI